MHPNGMRPQNGNMFFNRANGMQNNMQGMLTGGSCGAPGNQGTMMNGGGPGNGYFPTVNPGQTDLPSVSPRTDKSNICKSYKKRPPHNRESIHESKAIQLIMIFIFCSTFPSQSCTGKSYTASYAKQLW